MLTLEQANTMIAAAIGKARQAGFMKLAVAVLDQGGSLVSFQREDGAGIARYDIAFAKAWGSLGMGMGSRALTALSEKRPTFVAHLSLVTGGRMAASPGGVLIADAAGQVIGAIGISGDTGDNDEICAIAAIEAAGLTAIAGQA